MPVHYLCLLAAAAVTSGELAFMRGGAVHILDTATEQVRTIWKSDYDRPLTWSPDGRYLIVWKHSEIGWDLWRLDLRDEDDIEAVNLTKTELGGCRSASYSPDGKRIAFMRDGPMGLWMMNADGSDMRRLTEAHVDRDAAPQWSPDGRKLLYETLESREGGVRLHLRLFDLDSEEDEQLIGGFSRSPQWITQDRILFTASRDGRSAVLISDLDGSNERRLSDPAHRAWSAALSPDRKRVAYIAHRDDEPTALIVASVEESSEPRELLSRPGLTGAPTWSPDGAALAITTDDKEEPGLWLIDVESGEARRLVDAVFHYHFHAWRPIAEARE